MNQSVRSGLDLASELTRAVDEVRASVAAFAESDFHQRPEMDDWSGSEILAHTIEIQNYWLGEARKVVASPGSRFGRTKSDEARVRWVAENSSKERAELLVELDQVTAKTVSSLRSMSDASLDVAGTHHRRGEMTVREILDEWLIAHMWEHQEQLDETLLRLTGTTEPGQ